MSISTTHTALCFIARARHFKSCCWKALYSLIHYPNDWKSHWRSLLASEPSNVKKRTFHLTALSAVKFPLRVTNKNLFEMKPQSTRLALWSCMRFLYCLVELVNVPLAVQYLWIMKATHCARAFQLNKFSTWVKRKKWKETCKNYILLILSACFNSGFLANLFHVSFSLSLGFSQVDLLVLTKITGIITQGAKDFGHVQFVGSYKLAYSNDGERWKIYQDEKQGKDKVWIAFTPRYIQPPCACSWMKGIIIWCHSKWLHSRKNKNEKAVK